MEDIPARVAVLTPVFNRPEDLALSAESVLAELLPGDAYVIVDDGSDFCVEMDHPQALVIRHAVNRGILAARNSLLQAVPLNTPWVLLVDSDLRLVQGWRALLAERTGAHDSLLFFDRAIHPDGRVTGTVKTPGMRFGLDTLLAGDVDGDFIVAARSDLLRNERWNEEAWGFEGVMWARLARHHPGRHVDRVIAYGPAAGSQPGSASARTSDRVRARRIARAIDDYREEFSFELADRHPQRAASLAMTSLTWRVIAGDAGLSEVLAHRAQARRAGATLRWMRLAAFAAVPSSGRSLVLARRASKK